MGTKDIYIIGAGTYGEVMYELAQLLGYKVIGFYDEDDKKINTLINGVKVIGKFSEIEKRYIQNNQFIVAIGNNEVRLNIMGEINHFNGSTPTIIHPTAILSPSAQIGKGVYIHANTYIWTKVIIGDYCIISPAVTIAHHTQIGKACLISTLSGVGASIKIEDLVFIGMGSIIVTGLSKVGENSIIGAGTTVLKDVDRDSVYVGTPAKKIKSRK